MNLKKLAIILTASLITVFSLSFGVYADEESADEESSAEETVTDEEDEYLTTEDGNYYYSIETDEDTDEEYVVLEEYLGSEESIVIPEEIDGIIVREIGTYTFYEQDFIKDITVSKNVEDFGNFCFYGCTSITEFKVDEENEIYTADENGAIVGKDGLAYFAYPCGQNPVEVTIPDGTMAINCSAFALCKTLETINFPDSLEYIGMYCFAGCESLDNVVIPESVTSLEIFTFSSCKSLKNITLPNTMTSIGDAAFFECESMTEFTFPTQLTEIGQATFVSTGFDSIEVPDYITSIGYSAFGFTTDEDNQIVAVEGFTVRGYTGSYAQTYCTENEVEFVAIDDEYELDEDGDDDEDSIKPGTLICICVIAAAVIILVIVIVIKKLGNSYDCDEEDEGDYDDDYSDESDEEEDEEDSQEVENESEENGE